MSAIMRTILAALSLLVCAAAVAQEHHQISEDDLRKMLHESSTVGTMSTVATGNTVTINMVAKQFDFTPNTFTVNQGDTVVINLSVPANDQSAAHGILMDTYIDPGVPVFPGQTKTITFNATKDGTFLWACSQSACGTGHSNMFGQMTVKKITNPAPTVAQISPSSGPTTGGTAVTITGANFLGSTVTFGGVAAASVSVTSSTSIVATTPPTANAGSVPIVVRNSDGQNVTFNSFTYTLPGPSITSVSPASGPTSGGTFFTITSTGGFQPGATVTIAGIGAGEVTVVNSTTITALSPLGPANGESPVHTFDVVVHNPDGSTITKQNAFTYTFPPLAVSSISPGASVPAGGVEVTLTGVGFNSAVVSSVTFGGVAATNVRVLDAVTMKATVPAHAAGSVDVVVTDGTSITLKNGFTYGDPTPRKRAARH